MFELFEQKRMIIDTIDIQIFPEIVGNIYRNQELG